MTPPRALVGWLLVLLLTLQGVAVAAALPMAPASASAVVAAQAQALAEVAPDALPPCHGAAQRMPVANSESAPALPEAPEAHGCCDADCPNMTTCLLGAYAPAGLPTLAPVTARVESSPFRITATPVPPPRTRLRPPIVLHV